MELRVKREVLAPEHTFACGQTFRFTPHDQGFRGVAGGCLVTAQTDGDETVLKILGPKKPRSVWQTYFDLDRSYSDLFPDPDPHLRKALAFAPGLRVLRQDPFETLISFIISANNNIPRISGIIGRLCQEAGRCTEEDGEVWYAFPEAEGLAAIPEDRLRELGLGYRAPYIRKTARLMAEKDPAYLEKQDTETLIRSLQAYPGVGPKVARCTALFGYGRFEVFPADVWILRILRDLYGFEGSPAKADAFAREKFGPCAGIAQQYLYHCARSHQLSLAPPGGV